MIKIQMTKTATTSRYDTASVSVINYSDLVFVSISDIRISSLLSFFLWQKFMSKAQKWKRIWRVGRLANVISLFFLDRAHVSWYLSCVFHIFDLVSLSWEFFRPLQARSSAGERYLDTVEVGGSTPPAPTILVIKAKSPATVAQAR